jgi:peptidyl-prolyl cis-trans isomerase B (cyclophilin B)
MIALAGFVLVLGLAAEAAAPPASPAPARRRAPASAAPVVEKGPLEAEVVTDAGAFVVRLLSDLAPRHVQHFAKTARSGGYDGTTFHRIVPRGIIQGGDPLSKDPAKKALYGTGGLGLLKAEFSDRPMTRGSVAAVLRPSSIDSGGTQFFVVLSDQPSLTGKFTIFGEVTSGMDVVDKIGETPVVGDKPESRLVIRKVTVRPVPAPAAEPAPAASPSPSPLPPAGSGR